VVVAPLAEENSAIISYNIEIKWFSRYNKGIGFDASHQRLTIDFSNACCGGISLAAAV
jgi:hypothetical protein